MLGAGEIITYPLSLNPINAEQIERLQKGGFTMILAGVISYRDTFNRRRLVTFHRALHPSRLKGGSKGRLSSRLRGNKGN